MTAGREADGAVTAAKLRDLSAGELLALSRGILPELRERGVIRSGNAPAGDYAELLVQRATNGELARGLDGTPARSGCDIAPAHIAYARFVRDSGGDGRPTTLPPPPPIPLNSGNSAQRGNTRRTSREVHTREVPGSIQGAPTRKALPAAEVAAHWLDCAYQPTIAAARGRGLDALLAPLPEGELFLLLDASERLGLADPGICDELQAAATEAAADVAASPPRRPLRQRLRRNRHSQPLPDR